MAPKAHRQMRLFEAFRAAPGEVMPIKEIGQRAGYNVDDPTILNNVGTAVARMATLEELNIHRVARGIYVYAAPAPEPEPMHGNGFKAVPESPEVKVHALTVSEGETAPSMEWLGEVDGKDIYRKDGKLYALVPVHITYGE